MGSYPIGRTNLRKNIMSEKYNRARKELEETGTTTMKVFGQSMTPIIKSGTLLT
jgi:hypothetical protein